MVTYRERIADKLLDGALHTSGAVQIVGPKWCGKTTTAEQVAKSAIYFQNPDKRDSYLRIADDTPSLLLKEEKPLLLDEWQDAPKIWDAVRFAVDDAGKMGQYILTGSSVTKNAEAVRHTGTGRFSKVKMRTMSLFESGESNGSVSLAAIASDEEIHGRSGLELYDVARIIVRGGWPTSVILNDEYSIQRSYDYVDSLINTDISRVDGIEKNPKRVALLMRSLARNESSEARMTSIKADIDHEGASLSINTIAQYINALRMLYVLEEQEAWAPAVRAKTAIRTSPIRRFCDPSIAAALLRLSPDKMIVDYNTFGLLFESLCVRDIRTYAESIDADVYHYRDARGLECDIIIEFADGKWGAAEVKLDKSREDAAATNLLKIKENVRSQHGGEASFLMVITSAGIAYKRRDGVYSIPIACLKP